MKIYFCGSISGGRDNSDIYYDIVKHLKTYGQVLTEHVANSGKDLSRTFPDKDVGLSDKEIHDRDVIWLEHCDIVVAEVTTPSLGVGYEIATARYLGKKILCLFRDVTGCKLSAMIEGGKDDDAFLVERYSTIEQALEKIDGVINPEG